MTLLLGHEPPPSKRRVLASELSDSEITKTYGHLLEGALVAYRQDPSYLVEMMEKATAIATRRQQMEARKPPLSRT